MAFLTLMLKKNIRISISVPIKKGTIAAHVPSVDEMFGVESLADLKSLIRIITRGCLAASFFPMVLLRCGCLLGWIIVDVMNDRGFAEDLE